MSFPGRKVPVMPSITPAGSEFPTFPIPPAFAASRPSRVHRAGAMLAAAAGAPLLLAPATAGAQLPRFLLVDRDSDVIWLVRDANGDGVIDASEVAPWFDATNAAGTPGLANPGSLAVRRGGLTIVGDGDSTRRAINIFLDRNHDGDALDAGESAQGANLFAASDISFGSPQGAAFDADGYAYIANASNAAGLDAIYRLVDLDGDGLFMSFGEIVEVVGAPAFGSSSGSSFNPAAIVFIGAAGYMRNSGANFHGVYRFEDLDGNGRADDPGEFTGFWTLTPENLSGVTPAAGLTLEVDRARPGSLYTLQTGAGGVDQLVRLTDADGSGAAHEPGEAVIVYANDASGFTASGIASLPDGRVILTEARGSVLLLTDLDGDGAFTGEGESQVILSEIEAVAAARQVALFPCPGDWNQDLTVNSNDISAFLTDWLDAVAAGTIQADMDASGTTNSADIAEFLTAWLAGVQGGC